MIIKGSQGINVLNKNIIILFFEKERAYMYTWNGKNTSINYHSDLSGGTIIVSGDKEIEVDMNEIARFLIANVWVADGNTRFLEKIIDDDSNDIQAISIETGEKIRGVIATTVRTIRGDQNG